MEELEGPAAGLYDFLYRDSGRITSYYAQLFGGHISATESTEATRTSEEKDARANVQIASGGLKNTRETQSTFKQVKDLHDIIATDVLTSLRAFTVEDVDSAEHGSLVLVHGTVTFLDRSMTDFFGTALDMIIAQEQQKKAALQNKAEIQTYKMIRSFMSKIVMPSSFLLETEMGLSIAGTLKDEGMEEPISTYYFKSGMSGLASVYMLGIKEIPSPGVTTPASDFMGMGKQAAEALSNMLFPQDAIRVTPIALFRKLL